MKNILITGRPGSGKTTLIIETIKKLNLIPYGFYTKEVRENGIRKGFELCTFKGKKGILAHKDFKSKFKVGKYGVCIDDLDRIGVKEIEQGIKKKSIIVIDEIGKMELFSNKFKTTLFKALDSSSKVLATIIERPHPVGDKIKFRPDVKLFRVEEINTDKLHQLLTR